MPDQFPEANLSEAWLSLVESHAPHLRRMVANYRTARCAAHKQQIANALVSNALLVPGGQIALAYYQEAVPVKPQQAQ